MTRHLYNYKDLARTSGLLALSVVGVLFEIVAIVLTSTVILYLSGALNNYYDPPYSINIKSIQIIYGYFILVTVIFSLILTIIILLLKWETKWIKKNKILWCILSFFLLGPLGVMIFVSISKIKIKKHNLNSEGIDYLVFNIDNLSSKNNLDKYLIISLKNKDIFK